MSQTVNWIAILVPIVVSIAMTLILFLVGRLLTTGKDVIDELRNALRAQDERTERAFRDLFACIDELRKSIGNVDVRVARMEGAQEERESKVVNG